MLCLAFDIERSGARIEHETIGIGASIVDSNFNELDNLFLEGYFPEHHKTPTVFEKRCYEQFWSKHPDQLKLLEYKGKLTKEEREKEMIEMFQKFRGKWESYAKEHNLELNLTTDNNVYDGGYINYLICKHTNDLPIPYTSKTQSYDSFFEVFSQQRGLLMVADPSYTSSWGLSERIKEIYDVPGIKVLHDHNPVNDARTIAYDQQVLFGIRDGRIKKRCDLTRRQN